MSSGFGLRALKKEVKDQYADTKKVYYKHIVFGDNFYAAFSFYLLNKKFPSEVKLISRDPLYTEEILREIKTTLNSVRSEEVAQILMNVNSRLEIFPTNTDVYFYKDAKFHKFGGRAKPHELKEGEVFFSRSPFTVKWEHVFGEDLGELDEILKKHQLNRIIEKIVVTEPEDLLEKTNFQLFSGEGERFECENLYITNSPKSFFSLVENKSDLPEIVQKFTAGITNHQAICVSFQCAGQVYERSGSMVLPQSVTHEWGSFMLDFSKYDEAENIQEFSALTFIDEDTLTDEELAKKIKLMRRVLERVLPEFAKIKSSQSIRFSEEYKISGINNELATDLKNQPIKFLGAASALENTTSNDIQYFSRGILGITEALAESSK